MNSRPMASHPSTHIDFDLESQRKTTAIRQELAQSQSPDHHWPVSPAERDRRRTYRQKWWCWIIGEIALFTIYTHFETLPFFILLTIALSLGVMITEALSWRRDRKPSSRK